MIFDIRVAEEKDAERLLEIYTPYVLETAITFETEVPALEEFRERIRNTVKNYPYLVAEKDGVVIGYAYAGVFKPRAAYSRSVETTVYIDRQMRGGGAGKQLYTALEEALRRQRIFNANACIGVPDKNGNPYVTMDSRYFHEFMGYRLVGEFYKCGYKFDHWSNMIWMEKLLGKHPQKPDEILPFPEIMDQQQIYTHTVTAADMKQIEKNAADGGMPYIEMMENAGTAAYKLIREKYPNASKLGIITGKGNNGGDGFVVARLAIQDGLSAELILADGLPVTEDAHVNYERLKAVLADASDRGCILLLDEGAVLSDDVDVVVDALYGTGFHGEFREAGSKAAAMINECAAPVVALDIPSGINADNGEAAEGAVKAEMTVVFDSYKNCHMNVYAEPFCGTIILADIGIPDECHI